MAITKIHPIKATLKLSIDYICNPNKTDDEILISTYKCGYKTAAIEFDNTKEFSGSSSKNLARHLIQSFMPNEVTPETAHEIGLVLCEKHLKEKYEYVLTTHVDKGHVHNHIIFNNVSYFDGHAYISNKKSYHEIRKISDEICKKYNLSIIDENTSKDIKGKSYKEYKENTLGNSYKSKLKYSIDNAISRAKNWDDFLLIMHESGYEIKLGKFISFKSVEQERFTRSKTIGDNYSEEKIKERIKNKTNLKSIIMNNKTNVNKAIDIPSNKRTIESEGFSRWLKLQNLKSVSKAWNELSQNGITDFESFNKYVDKLHDDLLKTQNEIKAIEKEIFEAKEKIKNINTYKKYKSIYDNYLKAPDKDAYFRMHESEFILFEAAKEYVNSTPIQSNDILNSTLVELSLRMQRQSTIFNNQTSAVTKALRIEKSIKSFLSINSSLKIIEK